MLRLILITLGIIVSYASLLLNETFWTLDNWIEDINGVTGVIKLLPESTATDPTVPHSVLTNITHCPAENDESTCYRAEVATLQSLRSTFFPNCTVEYWLGFSYIIPATWQYNENGDSLIYNFQLHGGVNDGKPPVLGIRIQSNTMTANICGSDGGSEYSCQYFNLGVPTIGSYMDWVIHSKLGYSLSNSDSATSDIDSSGGFIDIWRNNQLIVSESNLLTSYNQKDPPYMKFGSYVESWKTILDTSSIGNNWAAVTYKELRLGNSSSFYDQVYTGDGSLCGTPCDDLLAHSKSSLWTDLSIELLVAPLGCIVFLSIMFYCAARSQKHTNQATAKQHQQQDQQGLGTLSPTTSSSLHTTKNALLLATNNSISIQDEEHSIDKEHSSTAEDRSVSISSHYLSGLNSFKIWWTQYNTEFSTTAEQEASVDDISTNMDYNIMHSKLWQGSTKRKVFWYTFGYFFLFCAIIFAAILYGRPVAHTKGLLPWTKLQNWTAIQASLILVSGVMMIVYFLPLAYLPHDFVAGREFQNDPEFLRRIGVVIPCHKSAAEIGEVVKRVLCYIPPENIVICDNGNFAWPPDHTFEVVKAIHPLIRYCYIQQGHKTRALWTGAHRLPGHCQYVLHLDDDTHLSEHMVFDESLFTAPKNQDFVIAVAFLRSSHKLNHLTRFTDFWYKITDHFHGTQAIIATRSFVPGPAGLWKRSKFIEIFSLHPSLPFGEDIFGGFTTLNSGYAIRTENRCMVTTFAPPILTNIGGFASRAQGYGASSLWKQRAHRWTVSALRITGKSLYSFFTYDTRGGLLSNIAFRLYRFREYKIIAVQLIYVPFCVVIVARGFYVEFVLLKLMLFLLPLLRNLCINYIFWHDQPELQVSLNTVLLSPFYNFFLICCAIHGRWKCLLWYLPNVPANHGMLQRLRPEPMARVQLGSACLAQDTELSALAHSRDGAADRVSNRGDASPSTIDTALSPLSSPSEPADWAKKMPYTEQLVTERTDVFELFDSDGPSSSIHIYTRTRLSTV